ncbi:MAG TPA: PAS domain S-box protein, partial [Pseudolabrys sp.]|nr:PAS domain S-box protein [Pseudolabrys sp.]
MADVDDKPRPASLLPALTEMLRGAGGVLDLLPIAIFICDAGGVIQQFNRQAVELWGRRPEPGQTHADFTKGARFWESDGTPATRTLLDEVLAKGTSVRDVERVVRRADGARIVISVNIDPLFDQSGAVIGAVHCIQDITAGKRTIEALEQSRQHALEQEQRLAATYEHAAIGITEMAPDGRILRVNEATCAITGYSRHELQSRSLFGFTHPEDIDADREAFRNQVAGNLHFYSVEKRFVRKDGRIVWVSVRSSSVRDTDGRLLYVVRVLQDITEAKLAEQRQKLLIDELNHRVKNTLATVQSLAAQTARGAASPHDFSESFEGRLIALSKAHDQLTMHHWESADLRAVLAGVFAPYGAGPERVVLRGEDLRLRPRAVLTLAMAFHELITNAAKYGALSAPAGRIEIRWQMAVDDTGRPLLRIDWREEGGPPVS